MLNIAIEASEKAGEILLEHYHNGVEIKYKGEKFDAPSIVTQADIDSERKIVEILEKNFPDHNIFCEEEKQKNTNSEYSWYVDPLDGTSNFSRSIPLFGISIGLVKNGEAILGVLYFPYLKLLVTAEKDKGAFANGQRIHVSDRKMNQSLYYPGGYHDGELKFDKRVGDRVGLVKIIDSSSYSLAQIAMGKAELYLLKNVPHDVVAGVSIVGEAGGKITDDMGNKWEVQSDGIVVSNGVIHDEVIDVLQSIDLE